MNPPTSLGSAHLRTFQTIFQHPLSHNLQWHDVHAMFRQLGVVHEEANGNFKVTVQNQTLTLPPPRNKDVSDPEDVLKIRHFLEKTGAAATPMPTPRQPHALVLIDHHQIRIFHSERHAAAADLFLPHDPEEYFRHAPNSQNISRGQEKPDANSFFAPVVSALAHAREILLFGNGTGGASEMEQFSAWLGTCHPEISKRVIGTVTVDVHHLTDDQLLAKARQFFAQPRPPTLVKA